MKREVIKSIVWALIVAVLLGAAIVVGSRNLSRFDSALVAYTFASIFIPYHWAGKKSANQLTISAQDPISHIPEYKVCAVRLRKAEAPPVEAPRNSQ